MSEIIAGAGISDIFYYGLNRFYGGYGNLSPSQTVHGILHFSLFTLHSSLFTLSEAKSLSQENIHYLVGISHGDCIVTIYIGCSHVEVRDA